MSELQRWADSSTSVIPSRDERAYKKAVDNKVRETRFAGLQVDAEAALTGRIMEVPTRANAKTRRPPADCA